MSITTVLNGETVTNPNINNAVVNAVSGSTIFIDDEKISQSLYNGTGKAPVWVVTDTVIDAPINTSGNPNYGIYVNSAGNILSGSTVSNSTYDAGGAGISVVSGGIYVENSLFYKNATSSTNKNGGGAYLNDCVSTITGSTFYGNEGYNGGALYVNTNATLYLGDTIFDGNIARGVGGAFRNQGTTVLTGQITLGSATDRIYNGGTITVDAVANLNGKTVARVVDASNVDWLAAKGTLSVTDGYQLFYDCTQNDMYVTAAATDLTELSAIVSEKGDVFSVAIGDKTYHGIGYSSLADALNAKYSTAYKGESVAIANPVIVDGVNFTSEMTLAKGNNVIAKDITIANITDAADTKGGVAIDNAGNLTLINAKIYNNVGLNTGAACAAINNSGTLDIQGGTFSKNNSKYRGGAISATSAAGISLDKVLFDGNTAGYGGAFFFNSCNAKWVNITGCTFLANRASNSGGATYSPGSRINIYDSLFQSNTAGSEGGALHVNGGTANIYGSTFTDNQGNGAAFCIRGGVYTFAANADGDKNLFFDNRGQEAFRIVGGGTVFLGNAVFSGNAGAIELETQTNSNTGQVTWGHLVVNGLVTLETSSDTVVNAGDITIDANAFFAGKSADVGVVKVFDANSADWFTNKGTLNGDTFIYDNDMYIYRGDARAAILTDDGAASQVTVGDTVYYGIGADSLADAVAFDNTVVVKGFVTGGAKYINGPNQTLTLIGAKDSGFTGFAVEGDDKVIGSVLHNNSGTMNISGVTISNNQAPQGGAICNTGKMYISDSLITGNTTSVKYGGAIHSGNTLVLDNVRFTENDVAVSNKLAAAVYFGGQTISINNCTFTDNKGNGLYLNGAVVTDIKNTTFSGNVGNGYGGAIHALSGALNVDNVTFSGNKGYYAITVVGSQADKKISNSTFDGNEAGAIKMLSSSEFDVTVHNTKFMTASDYIEVSGTSYKLIFSGDITLNASLLGTAYQTDGANFTLGAGIDLNGVDFDKAMITVDGALYKGEAVTIATKVGKIGDYTIANNTNPFLTLEVVNGNLLLKEVDAQISGEEVKSSYTGDGVTVMDGGAVGTFFATKDNESEIATKISGGKVESNLVAGAYVAAGNSATVNSVELLIGGTAEVAAKVYAGGYLYGNAGDAEAAAEAQMTVGEVNITLDGGAVSTNMYGGAHARQFGNASVTEVNITVTAGNHSRIYAGGWAEKGAVSSVGIANVIISGGTVDYLYGAGANADGKTYVDTTNITIENDAMVNTIFMGGRYGYSWVDNVNLTFAGADKVLNRLSGVSSAGMDYADATVVKLETNVTADLIDYVDKFVINEGYTLTANNEFYLGNRVEGGAEPDVTTFDFIAEGEANWTAVAGISDFTNAKFSVNGTGLTAWDGSAAIAIGGYELTYDAKDKTIKLAKITA